MIKVSVIVTIYNMKEYLEKCLDSLLSQTLDEIEVIAVDDGSTDASPEILKEFAIKSTKIIHVTKENGGLSDARNYGLKYATGEYIAYLDSDDFVDPDMYEVMYNKALECDSDIVECNLHHTYANYEDTEIVVKYYEPKQLLTHGRHIVWNKIYRRSWLIDTGIQFPFGLIYEDVSFFSMLVPYIKRYDYVDIVPVHYVQRKASINNLSSEKTMQIFKVLSGVVLFFKERGYYEQYRSELEYMYARILLCSSFIRMCGIPDRALRRQALRLNYTELEKNFPNWRANPVLRAEKSSNALFMKLQNRFSYRISCAVFPVFLRIKDRLGPKWVK